jgi:hypothetical protein
MAAALVASSRTSAPGIRVPSGASLHGGASVLHFVLGCVTGRGVRCC